MNSVPSDFISANAYITKSSKKASTLEGSPRTYVPTNYLYLDN
ncbi:hypothetical protein H477_2043 [[Clostridium] sordellii ATCC 9714]|nr:hypothetical protein H477_2043 [[Clostridium] sordellii ATCC 9714] [Paeniclostridium sordellii ATCC 9714]